MQGEGRLVLWFFLIIVVTANGEEEAHTRSKRCTFLKSLHFNEIFSILFPFSFRTFQRYTIC